ncbi:Ig-like domain-containing protein, partial [Microcoleus sp. Pol17_C1]|uniref:Ig-like domain-containing protein n=1 Tax=unclassified Microcoleus TaxID=2642155 RepID=UPI003B0AD9FA
GIVTWTAITSLASAASANRTVSFAVPATISAIANTASSTSTSPDPNPANNNGREPGATVTTTITAAPTPTPPLPPTPTPTPANKPPIASNVNLEIAPSSAVAIAGLGGSDPDGSIASFTINTVPPANEGLIFLGNPDTGGTIVTAGQILTPADINQLFFQSTANFTTANFTYSATDNQGATSPASATVSALLPVPNQPPVANNVNLEIGPSSAVAIAGLGGSDPDGSIASFTINTVPPANEGRIFLGNPDTGGRIVTPGQILTPTDINQLFFQSTANFTTANFTYSATDNQGATSPASATVSAIPLNEPTPPTPTPPTPPTPTPPTPPTPTPPTPPTPTPTPPTPPTPTPTPPTPPTPAPEPAPPTPAPEPAPPTPEPTPPTPAPTPTPPTPAPTPTPPTPAPEQPTPTPEPTPIFNPVPEPD